MQEQSRHDRNKQQPTDLVYVQGSYVQAQYTSLHCVHLPCRHTVLHQHLQGLSHGLRVWVNTLEQHCSHSYPMHGVCQKSESAYVGYSPSCKSMLLLCKWGNCAEHVQIVQSCKFHTRFVDAGNCCRENRYSLKILPKFQAASLRWTRRKLCEAVAGQETVNSRQHARTKHAMPCKHSQNSQTPDLNPSSFFPHFPFLLIFRLPVQLRAPMS